MPSVSGDSVNKDNIIKNIPKLQHYKNTVVNELLSIMQTIDYIISNKEFEFRKSGTDLICYDDIQNILTEMHNIVTKLNEKTACFIPISQPLPTYYRKNNGEIIKAMKIHHIKEYFSGYRKDRPQYIFYNEDETCSVLVDDLYAKTVTPNSVYHVIKNNKKFWMSCQEFETNYQKEPVVFITDESKPLDTYIQRITKEKVNAFKIIKAFKTNFPNTKDNVTDKLLLLLDNDGHSLIVNMEYLNKAPNKNIIGGYYVDYPTRPTQKWISGSDFEELYQLYTELEGEEIEKLSSDNNYLNIKLPQHINDFMSAMRDPQNAYHPKLILGQQNPCIPPSNFIPSFPNPNMPMMPGYPSPQMGMVSGYPNPNMPMFSSVEFLPIQINGVTINEPINNKCTIMHAAAINTIFKIMDIELINDNYIKLLSPVPNIHKIVDKTFFDKFQPSVGDYYVSYINNYISCVSSILFDNTIFRNYN